MKEDLLTCGPDEILTTIYALDSAIAEHILSPTLIMIPRKLIRCFYI